MPARSYRLLLTTWQHFGAGSIQSVQNLAEGLQQRGHDVHVATPPDGVLGRRLQASGVVVVPFHFRKGWSLRSGRELAALVRREHFELVDAQESRDRKAAVLARWLFGMAVPLVISRRQLSFTFPLENWIYAAAVDRVVANSHGVAKSLARRGVPRHKITVVQSGHNPARVAGEVTAEEVERLRRELELDPHLPTIGVVARRKDQETLLRAVARVQQPANVLFVGIERDGKLAALETGLSPGSRVVYTGFVDRVLPYYHLLDVKVLPSYNEGLPQALFEAMALGVPVVSAIIGGTPEMIRHGENGFLFRNGDLVTLSQQLHTLLSDRKLQRQFVAAGRRTANEAFTVDAMVRNTEALYRSFLEGEAPAARDMLEAARR